MAREARVNAALHRGWLAWLQEHRDEPWAKPLIFFRGT